MACPHAEGGDRPEMSPPRERKLGAGTDTNRKFSWATQRIHDLTKELEAVQARLKVRAGGGFPGDGEQSGGSRAGQVQVGRCRGLGEGGQWEQQAQARV